MLATPTIAIPYDSAILGETPPTWIDQTGVWKSVDNRVVDTRDGRVQCVSLLEEGPYPGIPEAAARLFLKAHADWVGFVPSEQNLKVVRVTNSPAGVHVTFEQMQNGLPVYPGELVVSLDKDSKATFYFSSLTAVADHTPGPLGIAAASAISMAYRRVQMLPAATDSVQAKLVVWAGDNRENLPCWRVRLARVNPGTEWEVLIEAGSGRVRRVEDRLVYAEGSARIFDPNPVVTSGHLYGDPGYVDNHDAESSELAGQYVTRPLHDILDWVGANGHNYKLRGPWVQIADFEAPWTAPTVRVNDSNWNLGRGHSSFEEAMCYFHIDQSQRWMQSLGFNNIQHRSIPFDAHGVENEANAYYSPSLDRIVMGWDSNCTDAAEDADVILHEYGHAIHHSVVPSWGGGDEGAMGEGWGDYWANSYARTVSSFNGNHLGSWGLHLRQLGRPMQANLHYPENAGGEVHYSGQIWSQALYELESGGLSRTAANLITLQSIYYLGAGASMPTAAQAVLNADHNLYSDYYRVTIQQSFVARGLISGSPENDHCPGLAITSLPFTYSGSTVLAVNDRVNCIGSASRDVFFHLWSGTCQNVTVSLCGFAFDTGLEIRRAFWDSFLCDAGAALVACNDDYCGAQSQVTFAAESQRSYLIVVHGYGTAFGAYTLNVTTAAGSSPNDQCPGTVIAALPYEDGGNTDCAHADYAHVLSNTSPDVVYVYTPTQCEQDSVKLCGLGFDTAVEIRTGGSCPGSVLVAEDDDGCGMPWTSGTSLLTFTARAQQTYYILIYGGGADTTRQSGQYHLEMSSTTLIAGPDACPGTTVTALPYTDIGNTRCAGAQDYPHSLSGNSPDVLYALTLPTCQTVTASLRGSTFDTGLDIRTDGPCPGSRVVDFDDDYCGAPGTSQVSFVAQANVTYWLIVYGYGNAGGGYMLTVSGTPFVAPNDQCPGTLVSSLPFTDTGNTFCATNNYLWSCPANGGTDARDVVYTLPSPGDCRTVSVSLCGSSYDTGLEVRKGGSCPGTTPVACNDDGGCNDVQMPQSSLSFASAAGETYYILVDGYGGASGAYAISISSASAVPVNDACPGTTIPYLPYATTGTTACATNDFTWGCPSNPVPDSRDVFYSLTLPTCRQVTAALCGSLFDTGLEIRTGGACPGAQLVACNDDICSVQSRTSFVALAGQTYYIIVDGYNGGAGSYVLQVTDTSFVPANDVCDGTLISSLPFSDAGSTQCAQNNYLWVPCLTSAPDGSDVVYRLALSSEQSVTVSLCGSGYDTGLEIRRGGSCPGAMRVICSDDYCGLQSQLTFLAESSAIYYIVIDGYNGASGPFVLNVTGQPYLLSHPDSLTARASNANVILQWAPVPGASDYAIYRSLTAEVPCVPGNLLGSVTLPAFVDSGVIASSATRYFYAVTALADASPAIREAAPVVDKTHVAPAGYTGPVAYLQSQLSGPKELATDQPGVQVNPVAMAPAPKASVFGDPTPTGLPAYEAWNSIPVLKPAAPATK